MQNLIKWIGRYQRAEFVKIFRFIFADDEHRQNYLESFFTNFTTSNNFLLDNIDILTGILMCTELREQFDIFMEMGLIENLSNVI